MHLSRRRLFGSAPPSPAPPPSPRAASHLGAPTRPPADTLTFTTWGTDAELAGFRSAIAAFEKANAGRQVTLNAVPYEQMFTNIDAQIQAGNPPDVFRVPYYTFGAYAGAGQLLDLADAPAAASPTASPRRPGPRCRTAASRTASRTTPTPR